MSVTGRSRKTSVWIGAALVAIAAWTIASNREVASSAWASLRDPSPLWLATLPLAVVASFACTALGLLWLTNRVARASRLAWGEMLALTVSSSLGNLVPMQPGLAGRLVYQQRVHDIPVTVGVLLAVQSTLLTLGAAAWTGALLLVVKLSGMSWLAVPCSVAVPAAAACVPSGSRVFIASFAMRLVELSVSALRTGAAFALVGAPIDPFAALVFATAAQLANAVPMIGSGLGVREWAVGLLAPAVTGLSTPEALAAELVHRVAELLVVVPGGLAAAIPIGRRIAQASAVRRIEPTD